MSDSRKGVESTVPSTEIRRKVAIYIILGKGSVYVVTEVACSHASYAWEQAYELIVGGPWLGRCQSLSFQPIWNKTCDSCPDFDLVPLAHMSPSPQCCTACVPTKTVVVRLATQQVEPSIFGSLETELGDSSCNNPKECYYSAKNKRFSGIAK